MDNSIIKCFEKCCFKNSKFSLPDKKTGQEIISLKEIRRSLRNNCTEKCLENKKGLN
jgi:hypothetical protein